MQSRDACQTSRRSLCHCCCCYCCYYSSCCCCPLCVCLGLWQLQLVRLGANKHVPKLNASSFHATSSLKQKILIKQKSATRRDSTHRKANVNSAKLLNFHTLASTIKKKILCQKLNLMRSKYSTMLHWKGETFTRWRTEPQQLICFMIVRFSLSLSLHLLLSVNNIKYSMTDHFSSLTAALEQSR